MGGVEGFCDFYEASFSNAVGKDRSEGWSLHANISRRVPLWLLFRLQNVVFTESMFCNVSCLFFPRLPDCINKALIELICSYARGGSMRLF